MSGISQEFTTFGLKNSKSGKFLTYTRHEIPLVKIVFKLKFFLAKHESFIILKVFKIKVVFIFHFDHFLDLGFGTIVDGATSGTVMGQKQFWVKPKMANSI